MSVVAVTDVRRLHNMERRVLDYLVEHRGQFVQHVPIMGVEDIRTLRVYIWGIRSVIGKHKIESRRGFGYRYVGDLQ